MNEKFDELAKGLAQSVTRRRLAARKHTTIVTAVIILATLASHPAAAQQFSSWSAPVNLGPSINTEFSEFHPAISADGLTLFFSSDYPGGFGENDLWVTHRAYRNTDWGPAQNLGPSFNTAGGEYGPALSPDGHWLFFCSSGLAGAKGNNLNIFTAFREDTSDNFGWAQPFNLGKGVNGDHHNCDPTVFVDPETGVTTLFFARLNKPGQGDWDIYVSTLQPDGTFGNAVLDPELSSRYRDTHPTVRRDGLELIFSSDRPGSLGRIDLWISTRATTHDKWSTPVNLGAGVNTPYDDRAPYLSDDGLTLIVRSDRPGGRGGTDFDMIRRKRL